ncbi:hypothetical protein CYLTODRAFT_494527 [Cylindrobasidium torrendii FP15055 ss-10]|uniref:Uncharacterized protein n=1 Tax=Cylindrobasidium torrendii FP15055 ss-10 TaxID=1314674 RepID=A0A0D7AXK3_9AGAR|nr:hypothetical protein CYLTODRAFT_494527 [Cylindrobasidium torrendii FP15055 ss-10]
MLLFSKALLNQACVLVPTHNILPPFYYPPRIGSTIVGIHPDFCLFTALSSTDMDAFQIPGAFPGTWDDYDYDMPEREHGLAANTDAPPIPPRSQARLVPSHSDNFPTATGTENLNEGPAVASGSNMLRSSGSRKSSGSLKSAKVFRGEKSSDSLKSAFRMDAVRVVSAELLGLGVAAQRKRQTQPPAGMVKKMVTNIEAGPASNYTVPDILVQGPSPDNSLGILHQSTHGQVGVDVGVGSSSHTSQHNPVPFPRSGHVKPVYKKVDKDIASSSKSPEPHRATWPHARPDGPVLLLGPPVPSLRAIRDNDSFAEVYCEDGNSSFAALDGMSPDVSPTSIEVPLEQMSSLCHVPNTVVNSSVPHFMNGPQMPNHQMVSPRDLDPRVNMRMFDAGEMQYIMKSENFPDGVNITLAIQDFLQLRERTMSDCKRLRMANAKCGPIGRGYVYLSEKYNKPTYELMSRRHIRMVNDYARRAGKGKARGY